MIELARLDPTALSVEPYKWAFVDQLFSAVAADALVTSYPRDHFKTVRGYDGEKGFEYEARALIMMGATSPSHAECLSPAWRQLALQLLSPAYRLAMSKLTGLNLVDLPMEVNIFHYGPRAWLGPHVDLEDKIVSHVLYFNEVWEVENGGCLEVMRSSDAADVVMTVPPLVGNSVILVRSVDSWHAVSPVRADCQTSRRSMTVTFYRPGSRSTMWPVGDATPLHQYPPMASGFSQWLRHWWMSLSRQIT